VSNRRAVEAAQEQGHGVKDREQAQRARKLTGVRAVVVRVCNVLSISMLSFIVAVAAGLLVMQMLGFKPMAVLSGSMEPAYATGSVVFVNTNTSVDSIAVGDTITYSLGESSTVVTHRVIAIDQDKSLFTTKGDANETEDGPVPFSSFVGRTAGFYIPWAGSILLMAGTTQGIAVALFAVAFIVVLLMIPIILTPEKSSKAVKKSKPEATVEKRDKGVTRGAHFKTREQEAL
jgi:signal peptidase